MKDKDDWIHFGPGPDSGKISNLSMLDKIDKFMEYLSQLTKEEADFLEMALKWDQETQSAFMMAKRIFEEKG